MQAEHQEKGASSADVTASSEAAGLRSNAGELVAGIHSSAVAFTGRVVDSLKCNR